MRDCYVDQLLTFEEPCLLENSINYCEWTVSSKTYNTFFKIAPQLVCIITDDANTTSMYHLRTPFSGCLTHVDLLYWKGTTYYFTPHSMRAQVLSTQMLFPTLSIPDISFSLEPLCKILQRNQSITKLQNYKVLQLQKEKHNCTLIERSVATIIADKLMDTGVNVQNILLIYGGTCYLLHPLLLRNGFLHCLTPGLFL